MNLNHIAKKPFFDLFYRTPCMPQMLRAALYDATLNANGEVRGASGTMMLKNQQTIATSSQVAFAVKQVEEIKKSGNHITAMLSKADLIQLGGYAAVEYCGGPSMIFQMGRTDVTSEADTIDHAAETSGSSLHVQGLAQSNLQPEEFVALMGANTIGFIGNEKKGAHTRWCLNPFVFDNTYFQELLLRDQSKYYKDETDLKLLQSQDLKSWVEAYAEDEDLFFTNWAKAHVKVSEFGHEGKLLSEFDKRDTIDGGYQEVNRIAAILRLFQASINREEPEESGLIAEVDAEPSNPQLSNQLHILRREERTE